MAEFRSIGHLLRQNGTVDMSMVEPSFVSRCRHADDVLRSMNKSYIQYKSKQTVCRRLKELRGAVTEQFDGVASMLNGLSEEFREGQQADEQLATQIEGICRKYRFSSAQVVCTIGERQRLTVNMLLEGGEAPPMDGNWVREIQAVCGREFGEPIVRHTGYLTEIQWKEQPRLAVQSACVQRNCRSEKYCGDHYETCYDQDGRFCAVLSDGMGSGGRAAVDSAMTVALAGRMMQAGFGSEQWLRMINAALILKSNEESSSTVDAVEIDLFTGRLSGIKAGAAPTFLYSGGHVCRLQSSSLPIGILKEVDATRYEEYVVPDDWIVMVSDGVVSEESEWLETLIEQSIKDGISEQALAEDIVCRAVDRQGEHSDDTTALVLRIL